MSCVLRLAQPLRSPSLASCSGLVLGVSVSGSATPANDDPRASRITRRPQSELVARSHKYVPHNPPSTTSAAQQTAAKQKRPHGRAACSAHAPSHLEVRTRTHRRLSSRTPGSDTRGISDRPSRCNPENVPEHPGS
ncbi:hypothetical protein FKP32DRAFT_1345944 [Trametes sanguinea]|nr:hypothetical protein FKP32DRAFT_1345944 [Trametes sanguinea]